MEYIYAALLLNSAGKEVNEENLKSVVKAAGEEPDEARAKAIVHSLKGVDIAEVIKNAQNVQAAAPQQTAHAGAGEAKKEAPKEEKKSEEEAAGGLASLFG
jgi:large subunit ribosomal protein L12